MRRVPGVHAVNTATTTRFPVLHVRVVTGAGGGPDKTILRSPGHAPARYPMSAAFLHPAGDAGLVTLRQQAEEQGCAFLAVPEQGPADPRTLARLLSICRDQRVAVWHAHDYKSNLLGLALRKLHPMRLVSTAHGFTAATRRTKLYERLDRWTLPRYDAVAVVSQKLRGWALDAGVSPDKLTLIPNGVETDHYPLRDFNTAAAKRVLGLPVDRPVIGVVGRLSPEKGQDRAIRACAALRQTGVTSHLCFVGDGPTRGELVSLVQAGLPGGVTFAGWQTDPRPWLAALDLLLLPSRTEGLPNAVLEAMASGVPVAAAPVGEAPAVLDHGEAGLVLEAHESTWPAALASLLRDELGRRRYAHAARYRVQEHYSFTRRMRRMIDLYDRMLGVAPADLAPPHTLPRPASRAA